MAVDQALTLFTAAAKGVPAISRIDAKSSGPTVHFLVTSDQPRDVVVEALEERLYPLAQAGELPTLDYHVRDTTGAGETPPGYVTVFP